MHPFSDASSHSAALPAFADALTGVFGTGRSLHADARPAQLSMEEAYAVADRVRAARVSSGARTVGRKIGFTNAELAASFGIAGPVWGWMYDRTCHHVTGGMVYPIEGLAEPRLEPEIVLGLCSAPAAGMNDAQLTACVDWAAFGIEIVQSVYPDWSFTGTEAVAGYGLHGGLVIGEHIPFRRDDTAGLAAFVEPEALELLGVELLCNDALFANGVGANAHGGPLAALRWLVEELARSGAAPLRAGDIITTGTLTGAHPIAAGEAWTMKAANTSSRFPPLQVRFVQDNAGLRGS